MRRTTRFQPAPRFAVVPTGTLGKPRIENVFTLGGTIVALHWVVLATEAIKAGKVGIPVALLASMQPKFQDAPANVADLCLRLKCAYNGEQCAFRSHPAQALFTVVDSESVAFRATFSVPAALLTPATLQAAFDEITARFAVA